MLILLKFSVFFSDFYSLLKVTKYNNQSKSIINEYFRLQIK